ncbi:MAG: hypothetical protein RRY34_02620 [Victivallaceae bacterium]
MQNKNLWFIVVGSISIYLAGILLPNDTWGLAGVKYMIEFGNIFNQNFLTRLLGCVSWGMFFYLTVLGYNCWREKFNIKRSWHLTTAIPTIKYFMLVSLFINLVGVVLLLVNQDDFFMNRPIGWGASLGCFLYGVPANTITILGIGEQNCSQVLFFVLATLWAGLWWFFLLWGTKIFSTLIRRCNEAGKMLFCRLKTNFAKLPKQ